MEQKKTIKENRIGRSNGKFERPSLSAINSTKAEEKAGWAACCQRDFICICGGGK